MKKILFYTISIIFFTVVANSCYGGVETIKTGAGGEIYAFSDSSVPLVSFQIIIRSASSFNDPVGKEGLADLTATLLEKGTVSFSKKQFESALDSIGGSLSIGSNNNGTTITGSFLSYNFIKYFSLLKSLLTEPLFDEQELKLEVERRQNLIANILKDDTTLLHYYTAKEWYKNHEYGRDVTISSLSKITLEDLKWFFNKYYSEDTVIAGISGDITDGMVVSSLRKTIEAIKVKKAEIVKPQPVLYNKGKKLFIIDKPNRTETKILLVYNSNGLTYKKPEFLKVFLSSNVFGEPSSLDTRLYQELREKEGFVYTTHANFDFDTGNFLSIYANPSSEKTATCLSSMINLFSDYVTKGITENELKFQKKYYINKFPFNFETTNAKMSRFIHQKLKEYPKDYDKKAINYVKSFTLNDVNTEVKNLLEPVKNDYWVFMTATYKNIQKIIEKSKLEFDEIKVIPFDAILKD